MAVFSGNGSNTAPSFTFSSDTNTGMYRSAADEISLTAGGTQGIRLDSNGRAFITDRLSVNSSSTTSRFNVATATADAQSAGTVIITKPNFTSGNQKHVALSMDNTSSGQNFDLGLFTDGSGVRGSFIDCPSAELGLYLQTSGTDRAAVDASGTVRIGGTLPSSPNATISAAGRLDASSIGIPGNATFTQGGYTTAFMSGFGSNQSDTRAYKILEITPSTQALFFGELTFFAARGGGNQQRAAKKWGFSCQFYTGDLTTGSEIWDIGGGSSGYDVLSLTFDVVSAGVAQLRLRVSSNTAAVTPWCSAEIKWFKFNNVDFVFDNTYVVV